MTESEFKQWSHDLATRIPDIGEYLSTLKPETIVIWFRDIFQEHELRDALEMNVQLMNEPDGLARYERHKLPRLWIKTLQEVRYARKQREQREQTQSTYLQAAAESESTNTSEHAHGRMLQNPIMRRGVEHIQQLIRAYKKKHGELPCHELVGQWTDEWFAEHAKDLNDLDIFGPRYRCARCRDSGFVSFTRNGADYAGACTECVTGTNRKSQNWRTPLGYAPRNAEDNAFSRALGAT